MKKLALVIASGLIASTAYPALAETKITVNISAPKASALYKAMFKPWMADVEKATQGRVKIFAPAASLAPGPRQWDITAKGVADVAMTANTWQRARLQLPLIAETPFNVPSAIGGSIAMWQTQKKYFDQANEYKGMKLLAQWVNAGYHIQSKSKPITSIGDLSGFKIRTSSGPLRQALSDLGAAVVPMPVPKTFELISHGTVDGLLNSGSIVAAFKYARYVKHVTEFPGKLGANSFSYIMNKQTWDGLPGEDKKAIESVSGEHMIRRIGMAFDGSERFGNILIKKANGKFHQADPAFVKAVRDKTRFIEQDWLKKATARGIDAQAALEYFRKTGKEVTAKARANAKNNRANKRK